jgi:YbbR domain-containing protein
MMRQLAAKVGWPLFSLAAAFVLWLTFTASPAVVISISAPVEYQNMPPDLETTTELPRHVYVEVQGASARLHEADLASRKVLLDLAGVHGPGERTFTIDRNSIDLPADIRMVRAIPAQIRLSFERSLRAYVPVKVRFSAPPPEGYRVVSEQIRPPQLQIVGPESRVKQIAFVETDPIDLSRSVGAVQFQVHTFLRDPQVRFVASPMVQVGITVEKSGQGGTAFSEPAAVRN